MQTKTENGWTLISEIQNYSQRDFRNSIPKPTRSNDKFIFIDSLLVFFQLKRISNKVIKSKNPQKKVCREFAGSADNYGLWRAGEKEDKAVAGKFNNFFTSAFVWEALGDPHKRKFV